ncbi:MAG TPA: preprotein translocase subunit YajC [Anaeromyxobacter sp.]|nr:preprotein translocase subunit YajC [Anaeromyxobacter sp.]
MHPVLHAFLSQTAEGPAQSPLVGILPFVLIAVVFYFVFFRPQARQAKQHQSFVAALKKGDEVVTQSGLIGTVVLVEDRTVTLDVGSGTKVRVVKGQVAGQWKQQESLPAKAEARK